MHTGHDCCVPPPHATSHAAYGDHTTENVGQGSVLHASIVGGCATQLEGDTGEPSGMVAVSTSTPLAALTNMHWTERIRVPPAAIGAATGFGGGSIRAV
eukprot:4005517-Pyramimonas_sp.AAC.2